ncbi:MAG: class I SAM-dependent RNA methyltransferase [Acidobacteriota bacterium]|nr:class I SAM-dependent RNA methyltransferase [Acidobacteriota bacterium]
MSSPVDTLETLRIERPASGGGVSHLADGRVVFVRHSLPGELVRAAVNEETARFARAEAVEVLEASADRVPAACGYARAHGCGGCDLQHASVAAQLSWKATLVTEHLRRIAGVTWDVNVVSLSAGTHTRTRLRCGVDEHGALALRRARSSDLVAITSCEVADERFDDAFATKWRHADEVELRAIGDGAPFALVRRVTERGTHFELTSLVGVPIDPTTHSRVSVEGHYFVVSPRSFWQAHREAPATLLRGVMEFADVSPGDRVVDLFSGVGLFSVPLARAVGPAGQVIAVEASPYAVRDARTNAEGLRQLRVREWSVSPRAINDVVSADDVVVLDPPRTGLARGVAAALVRRAPRRLVYVSCDAATFARDLSILAEHYTLRDLRVLDLFPKTEHVELVAVLDLGP